MSLAYRLINMTADEESVFQAKQDEIQRDLSARYPVLELKRPDLASFENMFRFDNLC